RRRERAVHRTARASGGARRDGGALGGAGAVSALGARNKEPGGACAGGWGLKRSRTTEGPAWDGGAFGRLGEGADQMVASASAGQLILIWTPLGVEAISTSSARPAMTARPSSAAPSPAKPCSNFSASEAPERPPAPSSAGTVSLTVTSKRRSAPRSSRRTGSSGQCLRCASTAREHASPTASLTSSSRCSATPLRRATAVTISRAVRTWTGSALKDSSTVDISAAGRLLGALPLLLGLLDRVVDTEDLGQPRDPEDLEDALLRAHQFQGAVVGAHALEPADEDAETRGVEELHLLHVHQQVELALVDQVDELLAKLRRRVDVDLALHRDDGEAIVGGVVVHLQVHRSSTRRAALSDLDVRGARGRVRPSRLRRDSTTLRRRARTLSPTRAKVRAIPSDLLIQ